MQEKIKQAYEKINISKEAKDRIQMAVMMQNAEEKKTDASWMENCNGSLSACDMHCAKWCVCCSKDISVFFGIRKKGQPECQYAYNKRD